MSEADDIPRVVLIRGAPGSGKSTLARTCFPRHALVEADMFFEGPNGYCFAPARLGEAHAWCQRLFRRHVDSRLPVVVANTFTRVWEIAPYLDYCPDAVVIRCNNAWRNIHRVPDVKVERMRATYEPLPNEIVSVEGRILWPNGVNPVRGGPQTPPHARRGLHPPAT